MGSSLYVEVPGEPPFEVRLDKESVSVGRAEENVLGLRDMNVSRNHFAIERRENGWLLRDRGSRNGTLVNRQHCFDKLLRDGDRIEVGGSVLTFRAQASRLSIGTDQAPRPRPGPGSRESSVQPALPPRAAIPPAQPSQPPTAHEPPPPGADPLPVFTATPPAPRPAQPARPAAPPAYNTPPAPGLVSGSATRASMPAQATPGSAPRSQTSPFRSAAQTPSGSLPRPPSAKLGAPVPFAPTPEGLTPAVATPLPPRRDRWKKLAEVTAAINQERDLTRLLERIMDALLSLVPARGAFVVLLKDEKLELAVARNLDQKAASDPDGEYRLSWQICKDAIETKRPVLTQDASADADLGGFASVANLRLRSLLCVPFVSAGAVLGVVYLDEPTIAPDDSQSDVIELIATFGDLAGIAFANARHIEDVKTRERLSEELKIASRIQRQLIPQSAPSVAGLEIAGRMIPAEEVGGDVLDFFMGGLSTASGTSDPRADVFISIGDVSGKGAGAGIVMASVRALLRAHAEREPRTDRLLVALNRALVRDLEKGTFVSLLLLRYSPEARTLAFAGAGHEHLLILRGRTGNVEQLRSGGVALGLAPQLEGRVEERTLDLDPGDMVVLYTDGATEAASPEGEEFGLDRVTAVVREARGRSPKEVVDHVIARVHAFAGEGHPPRDDLTVVALKRI